jgi:hypothetical protein
MPHLLAVMALQPLLIKEPMGLQDHQVVAVEVVAVLAERQQELLAAQDNHQLLRVRLEQLMRLVVRQVPQGMGWCQQRQVQTQEMAELVGGMLLVAQAAPASSSSK